MGVNFWLCWMRLQLRHNLRHLVRDSIKDFHFKGLNYVCFQFSPSLTIRLYIIEPEDNLQTRSVNIHNHLYDSILLCLHGDLVNTTYRLNHDRQDYNIYRLISALHPKNETKRIRLELIARHGLDVVSAKPLSSGKWHLQPHTEIHSVENNPAHLSAFMVFEFPTVKGNSCIFTKENYTDTIPTEDCYNKYAPGELSDLLTRTLSAIECRSAHET